MKKSALIVLVMFAVVSLFACKQKPATENRSENPRHKHEQMSPEKFVEHLNQDLNLTEAQKKELTTYFSEKCKNAKPCGEKSKCKKSCDDSLTCQKPCGKKSECCKKQCNDSTKCQKPCGEKPKHGPRPCHFNDEDLAMFKKVLTTEQFQKLEEKMKDCPKGKPCKSDGKPCPSNKK